MKRYFRNFFSLFFFTILFISLPTMVSAGLGDTTSSPATPVNFDNNGNPIEQDAVSAPIDGGITLLLAAGIGYGVKKHRENRKKKIVNME